MANAVQAVNGIDIGDIQAINTITDANLQALNTLEFTGVAPDAHTLISTHDIAVLGASASIDITSGIDNTYDVYEWVFTNMHPQSDAKFAFQFDTGTNTNYNQTITSTFFVTWHKEDDSSAGMGYEGNNDQAQGTAYQPLAGEIVESSDADSSISGILTLYAPSSSTYVPHFTAVTSYFQQDPAQQNVYVAGYVNTTTALTRISFKFESGNIDSGVIKMYGLAKS
jgi:hypothetical protein